MTSELPPTPAEDLDQIMASIEAARRMIGDGYTLGTITVAYDCNDSTYGGVWLRGSCEPCGAQMVMRASHPTHIRHLALTVAEYECSKRGHEQNMDTLLAEDMKPVPPDPTQPTLEIGI